MRESKSAVEGGNRSGTCLHATYLLILHRYRVNFLHISDLCTDTGEIHRIIHLLHLLPQKNPA